MKPKIIISALMFTLAFTGLIAAVFLSQQRQELRKKAATSTGTTAITLDPTSAELPVNQASTIKVFINTNNFQIDGVQFKLTLQGNAVAQIQPTPISGLNILTSTITDNVITFAAITANPQVPFSTNQPSQIAAITITPAGAFTLTFDQSFSKIANHVAGKDILLIPTSGTYTITIASSIETTPTPNPTPTPPPGIGGQPTPTPSPTSTPTPKTLTKTTTKTTPSPTTPSPTATPIPLLSRLFSRTPQPSPVSSYPESAEITSPEIPPFPWKIITLLSILLVAATGFTIWIWKKMRQNDLNDPTQSITPPPAR